MAQETFADVLRKFHMNRDDLAEYSAMRPASHRNPDRRVEALLQGERAAVESVIDFMRTGPPGAAVVEIVVTWRQTGEVFHGFEIRY